MVEQGDLNPKVEQIVSQYRQVAGAFEQLSHELSLRTVDDLWKRDGVGSCYIGKDASESGFRHSIAYGRIVELREARNVEDDSERVTDREVCPYHRANHGCVLGDLKGPLCIAHVENRAELIRDFGIDPVKHSHRVYESLGKILFNTVREGSRINPDLNEKLVSDTVSDVMAIVEEVKKHPLVGDKVGEGPNISLPEFG